MPRLVWPVQHPPVDLVVHLHPRACRVRMSGWTEALAKTGIHRRNGLGWGVRAIVQRVSRASVEVDGVVVGAVGRGLLVLLCAMEGDTAADERWLLEKLVALRVFADADGKMNRSVVDLAVESADAVDAVEAGVGVLVVSQFTLAADLTPGRSKGNRPSFTRAAAPAAAREAVDRFVAALRTTLPSTVAVAAGRFGADMKVTLVNDGPVTLWLDSEPPTTPKPKAAP